MHKLLWILAGLVGLPCRAAAQGQPITAARLLLPSAECALFPAAASVYWLESASPRFTPLWIQAAEAEQALPNELLKALTLDYQQGVQVQTIIRARLPAYWRQYFGFYNAHRQPCLFINLFDEQPFLQNDWLHHCIHAEDGGANYWHISYNLATHRFYKFSYSAAF